LAVEHPRTGEIMRWESDLPPDLADLRDALAAAL
jgi:23S rRNA pseudouridine1911/1915/1917 synthase